MKSDVLVKMNNGALVHMNPTTADTYVRKGKGRVYVLDRPGTTPTEPINEKKEGTKNEG